MARRFIIAAYIVFFSIYLVLFDVLSTINAGLPVQWGQYLNPISVSTLVWSLLVVLLAHYYIFKKYYSARPRWKLWAAIAALLAFQILFRYLVEEVVFRAVLGYGNYNAKTSFRFYVVDNIYFGSVKIFIGFVFFLLEETFLNHQRQALLRAEKQQAERSFLQAQMNPHFLFNALNNIYALAYEQHPQTADAVLKLSEMMRYVTYENRDQTTLQQELEYVQHMLDLHQLRCDYKLQYHIQVSEEAAATKLMPLLLIPIMENALKHGDLSDPQQPLLMTVQKNNHQMELGVRNKIARNQLREPGGIGLKNLRRRLELFYPKDAYSFDISTQKDTFMVLVKLKFS